MAKGTLGQVVQRAISDAAFRNRLRTDPGGALSGFDLTPAERAAIQSGDAAKLASFGVDQRMSKAFAMGEAASGASRLVGTDLQVGAIVDGGTPLGTHAILDEGITAGTGRAALSDDDGTSGRGALIDDGAAGAGRSAIRDSHETGRGASSDNDGTAGGQSSVDGPDLTSRLAQVNAPYESDVVSAGEDPTTSRLAQINAQYDGADSSASAVAASDEGGTSAFLTADERGSDTSASAVASSEDSGGTSAFMTADEMGNDTTGIVGESAGTGSDAIDGTTMADPATLGDYLNPEHQG